MKTETISMALAGNPNAGKTTLFNHITGARQHVGNYPGITVDRKEGSFSHNNTTINIIDLPGTYSLTAYSEEELVARDYLVNEKPQVVINIVDASNIERNLYLTTQFIELGIPIVIALNMMDVAKDRGIEIKVETLAKRLGIPLVPIIARSGKGVNKLIEQAVKTAISTKKTTHPDISYGEDIDETFQYLIEKIINDNFLTDIYPPKFTALKYLEQDEQIISKGNSSNSEISESIMHEVKKVSNHLHATLETYPDAIIADHRYGFIKSILHQGVISHNYDINRIHLSDKIDKVLTNRLLGPAIMLCILFGVYRFTFAWSEVPVSWMESLFGWLGSIVDTNMADGPLKSMIISGVIDGAGGVLGFVPLIMFMFFAIAILEDSGYLARVAFMMDRVFRIFGLHGSSVMPFIVSGGIAGGCAVPGVMATRTLRSPKEKLATLLTVPFMNCGAKLPVLALLIGAFFAENQALYMFIFTLISWIVALIAAKLLRSTILKGESTPFVMELPPYRLPTIKGLLIHTWERTWQYIKKAGTVILAISILIWAMMTYPGLPESQTQLFEQERINATNQYIQQDKSLEEIINEINNRESESILKNSIAGKIGTSLEPISQYAGFDWRTNIALVGGFAAKEVVVSTLGTVHSMGEVDVEDPTSLGDRLKNTEGWNKVVACSVLLFIMFYAPCFVTVVCIVKEAGSWKWGFFSMIVNTIFAFGIATFVFQIGTSLGV